MILIDFNNFTSIKYGGVIEAVLEEPKKVFKSSGLIEITNKQMQEVKSAFFNYVINELQTIKSKFSSNYGDILIVSDTRKDLYWRKQILPSYKESRNNKKTNKFDEIVWSVYSEYKNELTEFLNNVGIDIMPSVYSKLNNVRVSCEADETIAIISLFVNEKHLIVSNDGDYNQLLQHQHIKQYNTISKTLVSINKGDIFKKITKDLLKGQKKDDIEAVTFQSQLDTNFIKWLQKEKDVLIKDTPETCLKMKTDYKMFVDEYEKINYDIQTKEIQEGKRKARRNKSAFKSPNMGDVTVNNIMKQYTNIEDYLKINPIYEYNYNINKKLYMLDKINIPLEIQKSIVEVFENRPINKFNNAEAIRLSFQYNIDSSKVIGF